MKEGESRTLFGRWGVITPLAWAPSPPSHCGPRRMPAPDPQSTAPPQAGTSPAAAGTRATARARRAVGRVAVDERVPDRRHAASLHVETAATDARLVT